VQKDLVDLRFLAIKEKGQQWGQKQLFIKILSVLVGIRDKPGLRGVIPNAFSHIFDYVSKTTHLQYLVRASYLEIYQEEIR